jgi:hypothetical protein
MALKNMSLTAGATITVTNGTAQVFADDGITIPNGVHLVVPADADYQTRRSCTAKYKPPVLDAKTGAYGKDKKSISYTFPVVLEDGRVVFEVLRIEREMHPSSTAARATELNKIGAQLLTDTDTDGFWGTGSVS